MAPPARPVRLSAVWFMSVVEEDFVVPLKSAAVEACNLYPSDPPLPFKDCQLTVMLELNTWEAWAPVTKLVSVAVEMGTVFANEVVPL